MSAIQCQLAFGSSSSFGFLFRLPAFGCRLVHGAGCCLPESSSIVAGSMHAQRLTAISKLVCNKRREHAG